MSLFVIGIFILGCGIVFGALASWFYMDGRVEFYREKYEMEHRLKEKLLDQNMKVLNEELRIFNDIRTQVELQQAKSELATFQAILKTLVEGENPEGMRSPR